jgi:cobalamin synthase
MIQGFLDAIGALTILPVSSGQKPTGVRIIAFFVFFPFVGLFFGIPAMLIVRGCAPEFRYLVAWAIPSLWLVLSGLTHFDGLCRTCGAMLLGDSRSARLEFLGKSTALGSGIGLSVLVMLGKVFALLEAGSLDPRLLGLTVLLVPMYSRFVAVLFALAADSPSVIGSQESSTNKTIVVIVSLMMIILASNVVPVLGLCLLVGGLVVALVLRQLSVLCFGAVYPAVLGALVEVSEVVMFWVVFVISGTYQSLALM